MKIWKPREPPRSSRTASASTRGSARPAWRPASLSVLLIMRAPSLVGDDAAVRHAHGRPHWAASGSSWVMSTSVAPAPAVQSEEEVDDRAAGAAI